MPLLSLTSSPRYIKNLHTYLLSFAKRTQPLVDVDIQHQEAEVEFNEKWEAGDIQGWEESTISKPQTNVNGTTGIWCSACKYYILYITCADESQGQKNYAKQTVYDAHLNSKRHLKATAKQATLEAPPINPNGAQPLANQTNLAAAQSSASSRLRNSAYLTHMASSLLVTLVPKLNETKSNVERRFSLTSREREQELIEQAKPPPAPTNASADGVPGEEEEEEERIYNPLKLPLGWDGKPIPYWLYKLHGLGVEYRCEICSDHVYMGR
jgi:splicing factor 3A subunit 3